MIEIIGDKLHQWDVGRMVKVTGGAIQVHFANQGDVNAVVMDLVEEQAMIPSHLLRTGKTLMVYSVLDGVTVETKSFSVSKRERPANYTFADEQSDYIYTLTINAAKAVDAANSAADAANKAAQETLDLKVTNESVNKALGYTPANQSDLNALSKNLDLERERINAFTALPEGSTAGDAELNDIRVTAHGTKEATAGEAVRKQYLELEESKSNAILSNLCARDKVIYSSSVGCSAEIQEDGSIIITSSTTYGAYYKRVLNVNAPIKKLFLLAEVEALEDSVYPINVYNSVFYYGADGTNYGSSAHTGYSIKKSGTYIIKGIHIVKDERHQTCHHFDVSPLVGTVGGKIKVKDYIALDVSNISDELINGFDFTTYMVDGYFDHVKNVVISDLAAKSLESLKSDAAKSADRATFADIHVTELPVINEDTVGGFGCAIDSVIDGTITATSKTTYGEPFVGVNFSVGVQYLVVWTGYQFSRVDLMNKTGQGWQTVGTKATTIDGVQYKYATITPSDDVVLTKLYWGMVSNTTVSFKPIIITSVPDGVVVGDFIVELAITGKKYHIAAELANFKAAMLSSGGSWKDKQVLFMGDSLTAANQYQKTVCDILGCTYENHALGGAGLIQIVDGTNGLSAITPEKVADKDFIVFYAGYNNRGAEDGSVGDCYNPSTGDGKTIAGYMQYCINRIYECLAASNNLTCRLLIVTVDCAGKYNYIDADGYAEYPAGSGRTMETLANTQKAVANYNSLPCCDLWHNSGINRNTWNVFGAQAEAYIENPTNTSTPYPHNGDQLHKNAAGYKRIGECIAGAIINAYGK